MPPGEISYVHMGFRVLQQHAALIHAAASAEGLTLAAYMRGVVVPWAASDLGQGAPDMSVYEHVDIVGEAAKAAGLSVREYSAQAARNAAAQDLGIKARLETVGQKIQEIRDSARSGTRAKAG